MAPLGLWGRWKRLLRSILVWELKMKSDVQDAALSEAERRRQGGRRVRVHCIRASVYVFVCMHAYVLMVDVFRCPRKWKTSRQLCGVLKDVWWFTVSGSSSLTHGLPYDVSSRVAYNKSVCVWTGRADLQVCGVLGDVWRYTGQFEIGAVDHGAFTATFLRTHQILETLATQTAAIVLLTCRGKRGEER